MTYVNCDNCGKKIRIVSGALKRYDRHYCNNKCKSEGFRKYQSATSGDNAKGQRLRNRGPLFKIGELVYGIGPTPVSVQEFEQMKADGKLYYH